MCLLAGAVALRRVLVGRRRPLDVQLAERRHTRRAGGTRHTLFSAHRRKVPRLIVDVQVVGDRVAALRVDDRDRLAGAVETLLIERGDVVGRRSTPGLKQRRPPGGLAELHCACVGGVSDVEMSCQSLSVG